MLKKIPGSTKLLIDLEKRFYNGYGEKVEVEKIGHLSVKIELFGKSRKINSEFLSLLSWYEFSALPNLEENLDNIKFHACNRHLSVRCGKMVSFVKPIYFREGYRYVPGYHRYAINIDNEIVDTFTNLVVPTKIDNDGYVGAYIYSPDRNMNRTIRVHRMMALAWLKNNDFINKSIINHINGIKDCNALTNLEWCSFKENSTHSFVTGLNSCNTKMKTRDRFTKEIVIYNSATEMSKLIGATSISAENWSSKMPGYLFKGRYEIKKLEDDTPWYYDKSDDEPEKYSKSIFTITVLNKTTGEEKIFSNLQSFRKTYKVNTPGTMSVDISVNWFKEHFPDYDISYKRNALIGPYRVFDLENKHTTLVSSIVSACEITGRTRTELQFDLSRSRKFIYSNRWIVKPGLNEIVLSEYVVKNAPYNKVIVINVETGVETVASSMNHASSISGITGKTISKLVKNG